MNHSWKYSHVSLELIAGSSPARFVCIICFNVASISPYKIETSNPSEYIKLLLTRVPI